MEGPAESDVHSDDTNEGISDARACSIRAQDDERTSVDHPMTDRTDQAGAIAGIDGNHGANPETITSAGVRNGIDGNHGNNLGITSTGVTDGIDGNHGANPETITSAGVRTGIDGNHGNNLEITSAGVTDGIDGNHGINLEMITLAGVSDGIDGNHGNNLEMITSAVTEVHADTPCRDARDTMLDRVAKSDGFFKSQQRGDSDLPYEEKWKIASEFLHKKPTIFLERFGKFLCHEDLEYFKAMETDYSIHYHIGEISKGLKAEYRKIVVKNRRFQAMKKLEEEGEYFAEEEMKSRDPLLYDQMIGQFLTDDEVQERVQCQDQGLSGMLAYHIQAVHNSELYNQLLEKEEGQMEETESDDEEEEEKGDDVEEDDTGGGDSQAKPGPPEAEKQLLRQEFIDIMKQRFLNGEDEDFNYGSVDDNQQFDPYDITDRDAEEEYFNEEDDDIVGDNTATGCHVVTAE